MNKILKPTAWIPVLTMLSFLSFSGSLLADDTEIFLAGADPDADGVVYPNIMFIIDTSGSMGTLVQTQDPYEEDTTYLGTCDSNYIYVTTTSNEPDCSSNSPMRFERRNLNCLRAKDEFADGRLYSDELLAWRNWINRWGTLPSRQFDRQVDCRRDQNSYTPDGLSYNDGLYMRDGDNGPYSNREKNLPSFSNSYYLWDGNVQNYGQDAPVEKSRIQTVKEVVLNMLDGLEEVNVGLMRFNQNAGGAVLVPIEAIDVNDHRQTMKDSVSALTNYGWTPLSETFYEFGQYMYGRDVDYGDGREYISAAGSRLNNDINSGTYKSPVTLQCQKNYVVYLTDGEPRQDTGAETAIETLMGTQCANDHGDNDGKCLDDLADFYAVTPILSDGNGGGEGIKTFTIGFNINLALLADTGNAGYYTADDSAQLTTTLTKITVDILKDSTTFTAPAVPVNAFNRTQSLSTVYTSLFQPSSSIHWPGNLKRYSFSDGQFVGVNNQPVIDPDTGFFSSNAWSYWTGSPDGADITTGGAAGQLPEFAGRNLYTDLTGSRLLVATNKIDAANGALTAETFGATTGTTTVNGLTDSWLNIMINWLNGQDYLDNDDDATYTDTRRQFGDPLHARPVPIVYGGTEADPDIVIYLPTNDGQLHAINSKTGAELWSYIPGFVLNQMFTLYVDEVSVNRNYMLDGQPTVYVINDDGLPGFQGQDERAIMVMGMRRGGSSYFALDITDKTNPLKLWEINDDVNGDYPDMGQTWSTPQMGLVQIGTGGTRTPVAVFGAGYDTSQDTNVYSTDTSGNAIYMVNLLTGQKVWSAGNNSINHDLVLDMQHSIPAPPLVIDTNRDGLLDRLYVGDMGGRIWRMDFFNGNAPSSFGEGGILATLGAADLGGTPTETDLRRFYNQVDVVEDVFGEIRYFSINIGSGYRAHPLDRTIKEEFYAIRDFKPYAKQLSNDSTYSNPITISDLIDITEKTNNTVTPGSAGWVLDMGINDGEKVLGKSLTINGIVYFTSFAPGRSANACSAQPGINYLYKVNLAWGRPVQNLDVISEDAEYELEDGPDAPGFATDLQFGGIASEVFLMSDTRVVTNADGSTSLKNVFRPCSSLVCTADEISLPPTRTFWTEEGM